MSNQNKKGVNTNSNSYTIIYSVVLVVVVAFLLAFVSQALKAKQDTNVALDLKKQILASLNIRDLDDKKAEETYRQVVKSEEKINQEFPIYRCELNGEVKYVIPLKGMGLWGPISCFISLNADKETVFGAYFNHESETAGLGAEIKDNLNWQKQFQGKKLFKEGNKKEIALAVRKKVEEPSTQVDGVTGATLTCDGVTLMFKNGLAQYTDFLNDK